MVLIWASLQALWRFRQHGAYLFQAAMEEVSEELIKKHTRPSRSTRNRRGCLILLLHQRKPTPVCIMLATL